MAQRSRDHSNKSQASAIASMAGTFAQQVSASTQIDHLEAAQLMASLNIVRSMFGRWPDAEALVAHANINYAVFAVKELVSVVPSILKGTESRDAFELAGELNHAVLECVRHILERDELESQERDRLRQVAAEVAVQESVRTTLTQALRFRQEAEESALAATSAAESAQSAAGLVGDSILYSYFEVYASAELKTANAFRSATIGLILAATIVAAGFAIALPPVSGEVAGTIYRLSIPVGLAGAATYLGRQAGHHRRVGNWARALQVQLQAFAAFVEPVTDENTRNAIFADFAGRVLGAPPESSKSPQNDDTKMFDLLTAVAKRS